MIKIYNPTTKRVLAKLFLGDCLEVMKKIPDCSVDLVLTDPPYGTTACKWDSIIPLEPMWEQLKRITKPNSAIVLFAAQPYTSVLIASNLKMYKYNWVWKKSQAVGHLNAWRQPMRNTEDVCVFYAKQCLYIPELEDKPMANQRPVTTRTKTSDNYGNHKLDVHRCPPDKTMPATILEFNNAQGTVHPTQKPIALMEYLIKTYSNEKEVVLDFTMGSSTTGVACLNTNRRFIGIESSKDFFAVGLTRVNEHMREKNINGKIMARACV